MSLDQLREYSDKNIVIIGCNGFLGKWLTNFFLELSSQNDYGINIRLYDIDRDWLNFSSHENVTYRRLDITDTASLMREFVGRQVHYIFNCAGIANPSSYMQKPIQTLDVSYIGTKNILDLARSLKPTIKSVVCFSSSEVYGTPDDESIPTPETHVGRIPTRSSRSCYDVGKLVLETLCYEYYNHYKVPVKTLRPFNVYGPMMDDTRVIPNFMRRILAGKPLLIYGDGNQTRTYCYVTDAIVMILKLAIDGKDGEIYNVGKISPEINVHQLAMYCMKVLPQTGIEVVDYPEDYPADEPLRRCPDNQKAVRLIKYSPDVSITYGLSETYNYFKEKEGN